jgi:hypothetical protein
MFSAPGPLRTDDSYIVPEIIECFGKIPHDEFETAIVLRRDRMRG